MFKKNSWIAALLAVLSVSIFFIGCIDPLAEPAEDKGEYIEFVLTEFNLFGGNAENQQGWATKGSWDSKGKVITKDIGLTVEMLQQARYLVVEVNDGFPKNNFETIYDSFDAAGNKIGDWQQFGNITSSSGVLNPGMGERTGNTLKLPMDKIIKNYSTNFMDSNVAAISLYIQHWGNGGTGACIKSAKLLISNDPPPFYDVKDIDLPVNGASYSYKDEFPLSVTIEPSFASKQKVLWSIRKWTNNKTGAAELTYNLDVPAGADPLTAYDEFVIRQQIKSKVDFSSTYNANDEATQGRSSIIATDGANSEGTITLLATIKDAKYNETTEKYEDFTKTFTFSFIDVVPYTVPASGYNFFYVDLNNYKTQGTDQGGCNPNVPAAITDTGNITVPFVEDNQRINFKFTEAQAALVYSATSLTVEVQGTVTDGTGDSFRYHIGDPAVGSSWNGTNAVGPDAFSTITGAQTVSFSANKSLATCGYLILNHRVANAATVEITSIKVTYGPATFKVKVDGVEQDVTVKTVGAPPSIPVDTSGATYTQLNGFVAGTSGYGSAYPLFQVDLGSDTIADYTSMKFDFKGISGDVGYKKLRVWAFDDEKSGYFGTEGAAGLLMTWDYESDSGDITKNDGLTVMNIDKAISGTTAGSSANKVWIIIAIHAGTSQFQVTDVELVK